MNSFSVSVPVTSVSLCPSSHLSVLPSRSSTMLFDPGSDKCGKELRVGQVVITVFIVLLFLFSAFCNTSPYPVLGKLQIVLCVINWGSCPQPGVLLSDAPPEKMYEIVVVVPVTAVVRGNGISPQSPLAHQTRSYNLNEAVSLLGFRRSLHFLPVSHSTLAFPEPCWSSRIPYLLIQSIVIHLLIPCSPRGDNALGNTYSNPTRGPEPTSMFPFIKLLQCLWHTHSHKT